VPSRIAILDLGTNTFHLLIADFTSGIPEVVFRDRAAVKLGMGGINQNRITEDAWQRALIALQGFQASIGRHGCSRTIAIGTSALRCAENAKAFVDLVKSDLGITIDVISGDREAELIFRGVAAAVHPGSDPALVVDIGGGSVECIIGTRQSILWRHSFEIGGQRLLERFHRHDPLPQGELEELEHYLTEALSPLWAALKIYSPHFLIGASGTFDTLSEIHCIRAGLPYEPGAPESPLTIESFYSILPDLTSRDRARRMLIPGMIEMRVDMIVVTSHLIRVILQQHPFSGIRVSSYSLKEGVLFSV
jgi:exopolyphosphatase/guanosine-5'-triphosphate,3'-diphosphate pyrophosphatase